MPFRLPTPLTVTEVSDSAFAVLDADGERVCYVYFEERPSASTGPRKFTRAQARQVAAGIAKLANAAAAERAAQNRKSAPSP